MFFHLFHHRNLRMCRVIELEIDPAFRDEEEGGAPEDYSFEVEEVDDGQPQSTAIRTHESLSIFPQEFINNSQIAYLIIKRQLMLLIHANYCIKVDMSSFVPVRGPFVQSFD